MVTIDENALPPVAEKPLVVHYPGRVGHDDQEIRSGHGAPPGRANIHVAPEAAGALDEQVDGGEIGNHEIEVEVEALFDDLRGHQHPATTLGRPGVLAEPLQHVFLDAQPVAHGEAGMEELRRDVPLAQQPHGGDGIVHRVAHPGDGGAVLHRRPYRFQGLSLVRQALHSHAAHRVRGRGDAAMLPQAGGTRHGDERVITRPAFPSPLLPAAIFQPLPPGGGQRLAPLPRQGGGKNDSRAALRRVEAQQRFQFVRHVGVIGVGLVHHQHAVGQGMQPQGLETRGQHGKQRLVDGADADIGEKGLAAVIGDPGRAGGGHALAIPVAREIPPRQARQLQGGVPSRVERAAAMGQRQRGLPFPSLEQAAKNP